MAGKVGFEIEVGDWFTWKATPRDPGSRRFFRTTAQSNGVRPMAKHEVLHRGRGVRMEADEFDHDGMRLSDVEFVTDPFPLTDGQADLDQALDELSRIYSAMASCRQRDHRLGGFAGPDEHHLTEAGVLLSGGGERPRVGLQATHGLGLADIPVLYRALTAPAEGQTRPDAVARVQLGTWGAAAPAARAGLEPFRSASRRATEVSLPHLAASLGGDPALADSSCLAGLLTAVIAFIRAMNARPVHCGLKTHLAVMHRNDFATLFALLPAAQRRLIRQHQRCFIEAVVAGVFADLGTRLGTGPGNGAGHLDLDLLSGRPVVESIGLSAHDRRTFVQGKLLPATLRLPGIGPRILCYRQLPTALTIAAWTSGWLAEDDPVDLLTAAHFERAQLHRGERRPPSAAVSAVRDHGAFAAFADLIDWSRSYAEAGYRVVLAFDWDRLGPAQREILRDSVRGLGGLGAATDADHRELALFENRAFLARRQIGATRSERGDDQALRTATGAVSCYFSGIAALFEEN